MTTQLNIAKIRRFCTEARNLCPPETFSVINHHEMKLPAYNYERYNEGLNIRKNGKFQNFKPKDEDFNAL